ncbi:MAG TPA: hypothetical protein VGJ07_17530 [Rugosimonospora sp.]|jgi:hypothetical protein
MHDMFDEAIGSSPPSKLDIDAIVARKRRYAAWRSGAAIAAAGGVAAAVIVASVAVHAAGRGSGLGPAGGGLGNRPSAAGVASPPPSPAALPSRPPETPGQVEQRLAATLTGQLTTLLPGVQVNDLRTKGAGVGVSPVQDNGSGPGYRAGVRLNNSAGTGTFTALSAQRHDAPTPSPTGPLTTRPQPPTSCEQFWAGSQTAPAHPDDHQCNASVGPDGQIVLAAIDKLDGQAIRYEVVVLWAHSYVDVTLENYFEGWEGEGDPPDRTFLPQPQFTLAQLATLAEDPSLGI